MEVTEVESPPGWLLPFFITLSVVIAFSSLSSLVFLYCFRKNTIVAMGQPPMLAIICVGALMVSLSIAFYALVMFTEPGSKSDAEMLAYCSCNMWLEYMGVTIMTTVLIYKLLRVHKVMKFLALLLMIRICIAKEVAYPQHYFINPTKDGTLQYPYCMTSRDGGDTILENVSLMVFALALFVLLFARRLRHIREDIGDSRKIFFILCIWSLGYTVIVIEIVIAIPLFISLKMQSLGPKEIFTIHNATHFLAHFFSTMATVNILILPRMYYVWYERVHGSLPENVKMHGSGQVRVNVVGIRSFCTSKKLKCPIENDTYVDVS